MIRISRADERAIADEQESLVAQCALYYLRGLVSRRFAHPERHTSNLSAEALIERAIDLGFHDIDHVALFVEAAWYWGWTPGTEPSEMQDTELSAEIRIDVTLCGLLPFGVFRQANDE